MLCGVQFYVMEGCFSYIDYCCVWGQRGARGFEVAGERFAGYEFEIGDVYCRHGACGGLKYGAKEECSCLDCSETVVRGYRCPEELKGLQVEV